MEKIEFCLERVQNKDREILFRLLQYSLFEESETDQNEMNSEAIFEYKFFNNYFQDADRFAYFIKERVTNKILGFAMINRYLEILDEGHSVAEFMILPKFRRNKLGKRVAFEIFDMFKGGWEVKPSFQSQKAHLFWEKTISEYTKGDYKFVNGTFVFKNS